MRLISSEFIVRMYLNRRIARQFRARVQEDFADALIYGQSKPRPISRCIGGLDIIVVKQ